MTSSHIKTTGISVMTALIGLFIGMTYKKPLLSPDASIKPYSRMISEENQVTNVLNQMKQKLLGIENAMNGILKIHEDQMISQGHGQSSHEEEKLIPPSVSKESAPSHISTFENLE